jgi:hypothetical protein
MLDDELPVYADFEVGGWELGERHIDSDVDSYTLGL